jgi:cytochrome bd-type quinol oxidase subunit 2
MNSHSLTLIIIALLGTVANVICYRIIQQNAVFLKTSGRGGSRTAQLARPLAILIAVGTITCFVFAFCSMDASLQVAIGASLGLCGLTMLSSSEAVDRANERHDVSSSHRY